MATIEVSYANPQSIDAGFIERLGEKERAVRQAVAKIGQSRTVRWVLFDVGQKHLSF